MAALKLGAYDYIVKRENHLMQLPYAIDNAIDRWQLVEANRRLRGNWRNAPARRRRTRVWCARLPVSGSDWTRLWPARHGQREPDGQPVGMRGVTMDITAAREAERAKAHLEEELRQAQKIESWAGSPVASRTTSTTFSPR